MALALQSRPLADAPPSDRMSAVFWLWLPIAWGLLLFWASEQGRDFYDTWFNNEHDGIMEYFECIIMVAAFLVALTILPVAWRRGPRWLFWWVVLAALCSFYVAGEEISWGQHLFGWLTPEGWSSVNDQNETNLHNTSSWLDQKPRHLLSAGTIVGGLIIPVVALYRPEIRQSRFGIIFPPFICLPCAALGLLCGLNGVLDSYISPHRALFIRPAEVQECFFYAFVLIYLIVLRRRLLAAA